MNNKLFLLQLKLNSLSLFRNILALPIMNRLQYLLIKSQENKIEDFINAYNHFTYELYRENENLSDVIYRIVMEDENSYMEAKASTKKIGEHLENTLHRELAILQEVSLLSSDDFSDLYPEYKDYFSTWETRVYDFEMEYSKRVNDIMKYGYGIYAKYHMFSVQDKKIVPIRFADTQRMSDFTDYERERNLLVKNTLSFLAGESSSNALLYGDAGTGKSSTIKAIVNEYKEKGLRLIEVKKNQLYQIPDILEVIAKYPLKFIIFIDDLSFTSNDENFAALKSILEGGVSNLGNNIVIYATSNRRHLLKEDHQARLGDEVHLNDTLQETMSLSSRFGLTITFNKPEKNVYLNIVKKIADSYNIQMDEQELYTKAEAYAIRHNGRSPRTAKQFVELLKAGI